MARWQLTCPSARAGSTAGFGCFGAIFSANKELGYLFWGVMLQCITLPQTRRSRAPFPGGCLPWGMQPPSSAGTLGERRCWYVEAATCWAAHLHRAGGCSPIPWCLGVQPAFKRAPATSCRGVMLAWDIWARKCPRGLWLRVLVWDAWSYAQREGRDKQALWGCQAAFRILFHRLEVMGVAQKSNSLLLVKNREIFRQEIRLSCEL